MSTQVAAPPKVAPKPGQAAPAPNGQPAQPATNASPLEKARAARKSKVNPDETKEQKIVRLANVRVNRAVKMIKQIGNLATYKPTEEQVIKITNRIIAEVNEVAARLRGTVKKEETFSL